MSRRNLKKVNYKEYEEDDVEIINNINNKKAKTMFDTRLWTEKYKPEKISELAIHTSKIRFLTEWFTNLKTHYYDRNFTKRILIIYGPSGSCKSTSIKLFLKEFEFIGEEWISPILLQQPKQRVHNNSSSQQINEIQYSKHSEIQHFENFLKFNLNYNIGREKGKKIIMLDDLPNLNSDQILTKLNNMLKTIANSNYLVPLIICFNENQTQTLRKTFTNQLLSNNQKVSLLKLNKVAPTLIQKSLKRVLELEFGLIDRANSNLNELVTRLVKLEVGDLRSLINCFQFYSLSWENINFEELFEKDPSIEFFRTLGKVFYAQRTPSNSSNKLNWRNHPNDIIKTMQVNDTTLTHYLFQNYPLFCDDDIDQVVELSEIYSDYDTLDDSYSYNQDKLDIKQNFTLIQIWSTMLKLINNNTNNNRESSNYQKISKPNYFNEISQLRKNLEKLNYFKFNLIKYRYLEINALTLSDQALIKIYLPYFFNIGLNGFSKIPSDCKYYIQKMNNYNYHNYIHLDPLKEDEIINQYHQTSDSPIVDFKELNEVFGLDKLFAINDCAEDLDDPIED